MRTKTVAGLIAFLFVLSGCGGGVHAQSPPFNPSVYLGTENVSIAHGIYLWHASGFYSTSDAPKGLPYVESGVLTFDGLGHLTGSYSTWNLLNQGAGNGAQLVKPLGTVYRGDSTIVCQQWNGDDAQSCRPNYTLGVNNIGTFFNRWDTCTLTFNADGSHGFCTSVYPNGAWTMELIRQ